MTVLRWPLKGKSPPPRKLIVDPLPESVLHSLVADLPGPQGETDIERAARLEAQRAEVLSYKPRNSAEAMLATQCILSRLLADDAHRDASRPSLDPAMAKKHLRQARQLDKMLADMEKMLARQQTRPLGRMDPTLFVSLGLEQFLIPDPDDPDDVEEAASAVIVPLHPAPKMLQ